MLAQETEALMPTRAIPFPHDCSYRSHILCPHEDLSLSLSLSLGEQTLLPRALQMRSVRTDAPIPAILLSSVVTGAFVCMSDFNAVLGVDMLLYAAVLIAEIASLCILRFTNFAQEAPALAGGEIDPQEAGARGFRIPLRGPFLYAMFVPCLGVCSYIFYVTPPASWLAGGIMVYMGLCVFVAVYFLRGSRPEYFQQIATAAPALLETPACSQLNTPAPSVHGRP